jgi:PAS domain S-box-containing protein
MPHDHAMANLMAHGFCFAWQPGLVWLHVLSDLFTGLAYYSIPVAMFYFAFKRRDLPFYGMFLLFALFIFSCGTTHFLAAYTIFVPAYWAEGVVKAVTAVISVVSAVLFIPLLPRAIAMPSLSRTLAENQLLNCELQARLQELREKSEAVENSNRELLLSEGRFRAVFEQAAAGVAMIAPDGGWLLVNRRLCDLLGYDMEELSRRSYQQTTHPDDLAADQELTRSALAGEIGSYSREKRLLRRDGTPVSVGLTMSLVRDHQGEPAYFISIIEDISERKLAEEEREQLIRQLQEKTAELERFIYTVSHDLKSPLITISGFIGFLQEDFIAHDAARFGATVQRISLAAERMKQLLDELLELSRIGRQATPLQRVPFGALVQEAIEVLSGRITGAGAVIEVQEGLPEVTVDRQRMLQVLENLIDNAVKFAAGSAESPRVRIGVRREAAGLVFCVSDNGIGIRDAYAAKVFDLFEKLDPRSSGTGVGLAIAKRVVEVHGGRIWVESEGEGRGCTFCFTLKEETGEST